MNEREIVVRQLSPRGHGGLSVLELRGDVAAALAHITRVGASDARELQLVRLIAEGEELDEALLWRRSSNHAELHVHGSPAVVRRVTRALGSGSGPLLRSVWARAEWMRARAARDLGPRILLDQFEGALARAISSWVSLPARDVVREIDVLLARSAALRPAIEPAVVVLAGPVNAGKSTLFNALVGRERVVVSPHPGTTRDVVVERVHLGGWPLDFVDTAGERAESELGAIERCGLDLGRAWRRRADLVLWLSPDRSPVPPPASAGRCVELRTKCDPSRVDSQAQPPRISTREDAAAATRAVTRLVAAELGFPPDGWRPGEPLALDDVTRRELERARKELARGARSAAERRLCALLPEASR